MPQIEDEINVNWRLGFHYLGMNGLNTVAEFEREITRT